MRSASNYIAVGLGTLLAFASYNIGEDESDWSIEFKDSEPVIEKSPKKLPEPTTTSPKPVTKTDKSSKESTSIYSLFPEDSEYKLNLGHIFDKTNKNNREFLSIYDISIENYIDGDITTKCDNNISPQTQIFCIQSDSDNQHIYGSKPNALNLKIGEKGGATYNSDCLIQGKNQNPISITDNVKCLGGYDFNAGSKGDVKIKLRGTLTYDPESAPTIERNFGICPEGNISECAGVEIGVEINY